MFSNACQKVKYEETDSKGEENWAGTLDKDSSVIFSPKNLHEKIKLMKKRLFRSASTGETTQQQLGKTRGYRVWAPRS